MTTKFECKGQWRLPNSDQWYGGTLTFDPDSGALLEIFGTFNKNVLDYADQEIVLGKTTSGDITLVTNWFKTTKYINDGVRIGVYEPIFIIEGQHFDTSTALNFRKVKFNGFNLFQWLDISGLEHDFSKMDEGYSISYHKRPNVKFELTEGCQGEIEFGSPIRFEDSNNKIEIKEKCSVSLSYLKKTPYIEILNDIVCFLGFVTFVTYEQSYALDITFQDDDFFEEFQKTRRTKSINCYFQNGFFSSKYKLRRKHEHLVCYKDINQIFPTIIKNWYNEYSKLDPVFSLVLNSFRDRYRFSIANFMDNVRALEAFHRMTHNNSVLSESEYILKVNKIVDNQSLEKQDIEWLQDRLKYGNEPSLSKRIKELIGDCSSSFIVKSSKERKAFCGKVVDSRNYYTHYDKSLKNKALKGKKLAILNRKLKWLLYSSILSHIGLDASHFKEGLESLLSD